MLRKIIHIDRKKCNGCGLCAAACHEGAIGMVDGKAWLLREDYCDGLGDCLPACPMEAITFETREAPAYNEAEVLATKKRKELEKAGLFVPSCPASQARTIQPEKEAPTGDISSQLRNFPVQIKLVPVNAPFFRNCDLLIAADCTAFACGGFHDRFLRNRVLLIGCTKLDGVDYTEKLTQILAANEIKSIGVVRMDVPCCGGLTGAVQKALAASGKEIPLSVTVISAKGEILE